MFTLAPATDLVDTLVAAGIRASTDPATLNMPGVWVQVTDLRIATYGTTSVDMTLALLVADQDAERAQAALVQLLNAVAAVIPVRTASARTFLMPDQSRLPGLAVPFTDTAPIESE